VGWLIVVGVAMLSLVAADPLRAEGSLDLGARKARVEGTPERFVVCDRVGAGSILGLVLGSRIVAVAPALEGQSVALDARRCAPPVASRPSVQCDQGHGKTSIHLDVRLIDRTRRIGQGVFGERWEYRALRLRRMVGQEAVTWVDHQVELPLDELFEDRAVRRVAPLGSAAAEGCGTGFLVVRSHVEYGAALALYAPASSGGLEPAAASAPLGGPGRWRDVIGVADVVGDGRPRVVEVAEPHVIGRLQIDDIRDGRIAPISGLDGYTSHRFGTARQGIGALISLTGHDIADIVVPTRDWTCLAVLTARGAVLRERTRLSCAAAPLIDVTAADLDGDGQDEVVAVRADGTIEAWRRRTAGTDGSRR
jgi:hypothetical protein